MEISDKDLIDLLVSSFEPLVGSGTSEEIGATYHSGFGPAPETEQHGSVVIIGGQSSDTFYWVPFDLDKMRACVTKLIEASQQTSAGV